MTERYEQGTLGWWMVERRAELDLTWAEVAGRAGVSVMTLLRNAENPTGMRPTTRGGIERALHWEPGSVKEILRGGEPTSAAAVEEIVTPRGTPEPAEPWSEEWMRLMHRLLPMEMFLEISEMRRRYLEQYYAERERPSDTG